WEAGNFLGQKGPFFSPREVKRGKTDRFARADHPLVPLRRSQNGSIAAIIDNKENADKQPF
ncbi:MAG TPA: hypothetical protein PLJ03_09905, partial [Syntrophales bacterium]|nr:hypothetical protein [Syntrophales bacterium]